MTERGTGKIRVPINALVATHLERVSEALHGRPVEASRMYGYGLPLLSVVCEKSPARSNAGTRLIANSRFPDCRASARSTSRSASPAFPCASNARAR